MSKILDVAQYIYDYYKELTQEQIDELKLQKLLYFCQREKLALMNEPLFNDEMQGWIHGPVSPLVRSYYDKTEGIMTDVSTLSDEDRYIIRNVINQYGNIASWKLRNMSHDEYSWQQSRIGLLPNQRGSKVISIDDIRLDADKVRPFDYQWGMYYDEFEDVEDQ